MLKTFLISGTLSLALAGALWYEHKTVTSQAELLQTTKTTVETQKGEIAQAQAAVVALQQFQELTNARLKAVEDRKQDFRVALGKAVAANPADAARVTPPAVVSELCARARCRDQPTVNKVGR